MGKEIETESFTYVIIRSSRKTMALEVRRDGKVVVRAPQSLSEEKIRRFVSEKAEWVLKNLEKADEIAEEHKGADRLSPDQRAYYQQQAAAVFEERAMHFARLIGVEFNRITIREQKTRWGSCSSNRNLNFNWKVVLAPPEVLDYVVVHELCHLKEMNHSPAFWEEVSRVLPDYEKQIHWLKENGWRLAQA